MSLEYAQGISAGILPVALTSIGLIPATQYDVGFALELIAGWLFVGVIAVLLIRKRAST